MVTKDKWYDIERGRRQTNRNLDLIFLCCGALAFDKAQQILSCILRKSRKKSEFQVRIASLESQLATSEKARRRYEIGSEVERSREHDPQTEDKTARAMHMSSLLSTHCQLDLPLQSPPFLPK